MEPHICVFAPRRAKRVLSKCYDLWIISKPLTHDSVSSGQMKDYTTPVNRASFTPSPRATYSASAVDKASHLCVLLAQLTAAPPKLIAVPDSERLSFNLSTQSSSLQIVRCNPELLAKVKLIPFVPWRYAMIFRTAFQCLPVGW